MREIGKNFIWMVFVMAGFGFVIITLFQGAIGAMGGSKKQADMILKRTVYDRIVPPSHSGGFMSDFIAGFKKQDPKPLTWEQIEERRRKLGY